MRKKTVERKESKRGFIAFTKTIGGSLSDGGFHSEQIAENKFALKGPTQKDQTRDLMIAVRDLAKEIIEDGGHDFTKWRQLLKNETADSSYVAALILKKGAAIQHALNVMEKTDNLGRVKANAYEAVHAALSLAFYMGALNVVKNEAAIDSTHKRRTFLKAENDRRSGVTDRHIAYWQGLADQVWKIDPGLSKIKVAERIQAQLPEGRKKSVRQIRKYIKKKIR